jgi:predicted  nucleic acid-binding Zn-ribbon protein
MTPEKAFELFPKVKEVFTCGGETFLTEQEANDYTKHFNLGKALKIERPAVVEKAKPAKAKATETAEATGETTEADVAKSETETK